VRVAALVGGDHHAAVGRKPLHTLLHAAVAVGAPEVAPACMPMSKWLESTQFAENHVSQSQTHIWRTELAS
jgi:hypothetical protein